MGFSNALDSGSFLYLLADSRYRPFGFASIKWTGELSPHCPLFELCWTDVANVTVSALAIVKTLDVVEHVRTCLIPGPVRTTPDAFALQETSLCALPLDELETLCRKIPELQKNFLRRLGGELSVSRYECSSLRQEASHLRTLAFLRELHERQSNQTNSRSREVHLPMSKQDIACYLGLTPESLSRSLKKLEKQGLVRNSLRSITLL